MKCKKRLVERRFDYRDPVAVANRRLLVIVVLGLVFLFGMAMGAKADRFAEGVCVTQLDKKSNWAVNYSKARGEYPF